MKKILALLLTIAAFGSSTYGFFGNQCCDSWGPTYGYCCSDDCRCGC